MPNTQPVETTATDQTTTETEVQGVAASLGLNTQLFVFQLINFVIVAIILWFLILKPLIKKMEERKKIISARPRLEIMVSIGRPIFGITDRIELTQLCFASISEQVADLERIDNFYIV